MGMTMTLLTYLLGLSTGTLCLLGWQRTGRLTRAQRRDYTRLQRTVAVHDQQLAALAQSIGLLGDQEDAVARDVTALVEAVGMDHRYPVDPPTTAPEPEPEEPAAPGCAEYRRVHERTICMDPTCRRCFPEVSALFVRLSVPGDTAARLWPGATPAHVELAGTLHELEDRIIDKLAQEPDSYSPERCEQAACPYCGNVFYAPEHHDPLKQHMDYCPQRPADDDDDSELPVDDRADELEPTDPPFSMFQAVTIAGSDLCEVCGHSPGIHDMYKHHNHPAPEPEPDPQTECVDTAGQVVQATVKQVSPRAAAARKTKRQMQRASRRANR